LSPGPGALAVGPEGGLAPDELGLLLDAGFQPLGLGRWVLRVDTAIVVGLSRWTAAP
jgi:16S rRNA (uracil1498-N3)-methyltransferase